MSTNRNQRRNRKLAERAAAIKQLETIALALARQLGAHGVPLPAAITQSTYLVRGKYDIGGPFVCIDLLHECGVAFYRAHPQHRPPPLVINRIAPQEASA